jgi:hypothetical protein
MAKKELRKRKETAAGKRVLVWHVFRWKERYAVDPRDWPAERGLLFVRQVVSPVDTESTHYLGQLRDLETLASDWRQYHVWKSIWEDLRALTATQARIHQGYLLDEHQQPLKEVQIAARLHADLEETRRALEALRAVNLMERVPAAVWRNQTRASGTERNQRARQITLRRANSHKKKILRARRCKCRERSRWRRGGKPSWRWRNQRFGAIRRCRWACSRCRRRGFLFKGKRLKRQRQSQPE